jgi:hypothetical protein
MPLLLAGPARPRGALVLPPVDLRLGRLALALAMVEHVLASRLPVTGRRAAAPRRGAGLLAGARGGVAGCGCGPAAALGPQRRHQLLPDEVDGPRLRHATVERRIHPREAWRRDLLQRATQWAQTGVGGRLSNRR